MQKYQHREGKTERDGETEPLSRQGQRQCGPPEPLGRAFGPRAPPITQQVSLLHSHRIPEACSSETVNPCSAGPKNTKHIESSSEDTGEGSAEGGRSKGQDALSGQGKPKCLPAPKNTLVQCTYPLQQIRGLLQGNTEGLKIKDLEYYIGLLVPILNIYVIKFTS